MILIKSSTALKVEPEGRMQSSLQMQQQTTQHVLYEFCQSVWAISVQYDVVFRKQQAKCIRFLTCCHIIEKEIIKTVILLRNEPQGNDQNSFSVMLSLIYLQCATVGVLSLLLFIIIIMYSELFHGAVLVQL